MIAAGLIVVAIVAVGVGLTLWTGVPLRLEERLFFGVVLGVLAVCAASFAWFLAAGMGSSTLMVGLGVPALGAGAGYRLHTSRLRAEWHSARTRLGRRARDASSLRPFVVFTVACGAVTTRIMSLAYQTTPRGISAGSLATWADWAAHLAYSGSFAYGDNRELELPLAAGTPLKYHFLANYFGSLFTVTGLELQRALVVSAWLLAVSFPPLMWCAVLRLSGSRATSAVSVLLFTLSGGIGAWYFLDDVEQGGWRIITSLPQTYARMPEEHLWVDNAISASLFAQRSTLLGMTIGMAALMLLLASRPAWRRGGFLTAGIIVGATGIAFVHLLFTALALGTLAAWVDRRRTWLWFLGPAAAIGLPLALAINPPQSALRWMVGWMALDSDQSWLTFWLRNVGLWLPLFVGIAVFGGAPHRLRRLSTPLWMWFIVPNLVAFHPSEWNNTKFFLFWQWAGCVVIAAFLVGVARAARRAHRGVAPRVRRSGALLFASLAFAAVTVTGGLDTVRAMQRSTAIPWVDTDDVAAALWLRERASPGERLVYGASNTSAVAALSGVPALSGYPGWTDDLGLPDAIERWNASWQILSGSDETDALVRRYSIDYVIIGPRERFEAGADDEYWLANGTLVFEQGDYRIFEV